MNGRVSCRLFSLYLCFFWPFRVVLQVFVQLGLTDACFHIAGCMLQCAVLRALVSSVFWVEIASETAQNIALLDYFVWQLRLYSTMP
mmetsp:Transcript_141467/g.452211  ORF Transcript_141467/g.452211 Transcript_141467/m.452211 type:complete len:87 (+) Transcript_141467:797-1057(+)